MSPKITNMKMPLLFLLLSICSGVVVQAQNSRFPPIDKSPMDMSYYPVNYPVLRIQPQKSTEPLMARIIYSRPQKMGRKVFGELVEDAKIWRLGANEATEIEFYREVKIGNKKVKKGRYTLYAVENKEKWTIILNTENDIWGAFGYDAAKDVLRVDLPVQRTPENVEAFTMVFEKAGERGARLVIAWDDAMVQLPISW